MPRPRPRSAGARDRVVPGARRRAGASCAALRPRTRSSRCAPTIPPTSRACTTRGRGAHVRGPLARGPARPRRCRPGGRPRCRGNDPGRERSPPRWEHRQACRERSPGVSSSRGCRPRCRAPAVGGAPAVRPRGSPRPWASRRAWRLLRGRT